MRALTLCIVGIVACSTANNGNSSDQEPGIAQEALTHASLASVMPEHLAIMFSMGWFGVPTSDGGADPGWGNWQISSPCSAHGQPATCVSGQRDVASRYRPLTGVYSSSGRDAESRAHVRLMLSALRRPCADDVGARIDSFAIQLAGSTYTSLHTSKYSNSAETAYQALLHTYAEADAAGLENAVVPADDATWYWNNGAGEGLDCTKTRTTCVADVKQDVIDMLTLAVRHPSSSLHIVGKPVLYLYISNQLKPSEWADIFAQARSKIIDGTTHDFFAFASKQGAGGSDYFSAFDAISPWIDRDAWNSTHGTSVRAHAAAYAAAQHKELYDNVPSGKVVLGGVAPGFDDFTNGWSKCGSRQIPVPPEGKPRDAGVLDGAIDYLESKHAKGVVLQTWDDWNEGSFFEPSVSEGTSKLTQLKARLGDLYGEPTDASTSLRDRWSSYGQAQGCGTKKAPPTIALCDASAACSPPVVLEPTAGEVVGPAIHLRTSAPDCLTAVIPYLDDVRVPSDAKVTSLDQWVSVTPGPHVLNMNGWDVKGHVYVSSKVSFER